MITVYGAKVGNSVPFTSYNADGTVRNTDGTLNQETGAATATNAKTGETTSSPGSKGCDLTHLDICVTNGLKNGMGFIVGALAYLILVISSFLLWIVGGLFNWVIIKTVFQFGSYFGASDGMLIAWGIMRDIGNLILLFGFIFMGIATILNTHGMDEFSAKKALPRLIIFAVLLNFSLFATQLVIDASNGLASVFAAQSGYADCNAQNDIKSADTCANVGIAGSILQMAGISGIWSGLSLAGDLFSRPAEQGPILLGLAVFVTITAVVLLAAAIMLIFRAVMLCFLMVVSPIGFAGMAIPPLNEFASDWRKKLISNAFFAPVYLLLVLISLKIIEGLIGTTTKGTTLTDALLNHSGENGPQLIVIFGLVIGFMVGALIYAQKAGAFGASFATGAAGKVVGGSVFGTTGFIGRRTVGRGAMAARSAVLSNRRAVQRVIGRGNTLALARGLKKTTESSFDLRTSKAGKALGKATGIDFGKPGKAASHGIHGIEEAEVKKRLEFAKDLKMDKEQVKTLKEIEGAIKNQTEEDRNNLRDLSAEHEASLAPLRTLISAGEARVRAATSDEERRDANLALNNLQLKLADIKGEQAKERSLLTDEQKARMEGLKKDEKDAKAAASLSYAEEIEHGTMGNTFIDKISLGGHIGHEAAEKIKKNGNKSDIEKALDTIKEKTEKKDDHADDHGGDAHSAGGGGGGGHAKAAHGHA